MCFHQLRMYTVRAVVRPDGHVDKLVKAVTVKRKEGRESYT